MNSKWTFEKLQEEALKYKTRSDFRKNSHGAYLSASRQKFLDLICGHMEKIYHSDWLDEELHQEALKYKTRSEFYTKSPSAYQASHKRGNWFLDKICSHMPKRVIRSGKNNYNFKWTIEILQEEALKYDTRYEFYKNNPRAYNCASKRGLLDRICGHMTDALQYWSVNSIHKEALKYNSRTEFYKGTPGAYSAALRMGIIDQVCNHMKVLGTVSKLEIKLLNTIRISYSNTRKLVDRKVKIINKPYIKGFDIDIFVPELNKGIEFDGTYYHSFECMRKQIGKRFWSDEDIHNYHQIKDAHFLSKGIQILHITQADWIKDENLCIQKCLDFLSNDQIRNTVS